MIIKTRFAPSPTGFIHIGNIRTAFFSWLYAKKHNGEFIIRIDDTDLERSSIIYKNNILKVLNWLELKSENDIIYQSKRNNRYLYIVKNLIENNFAYKCYCSKERLNNIKNIQIKKKENIKYDGFCKKNLNKNNDNFVIRINSEKFNNIEFYDTIKGVIKFDIKELDDFIISKNNYQATYNLASVIDDIDFEITNIIRGDDHISNTPKQIMIFKSLNAKIPNFTHLPMILNEDKKPLSKRDNDSRIDIYKDKGFLPNALLNYIIKLGWGEKNKEIFTRDEMINLFNLDNINSSPSILNKSKLIWINKMHMKNSSINDLLIKMIPIEKKFNINYTIGPSIKLLLSFKRYKINYLEELLTENKYLYTDKIEIDKNELQIYMSEKYLNIIKNIYIIFKNYKNEWNIENIKKIINNILEENNIKINEIAPILRLLITGTNKPNPIYETIFLTGKILLLKKIRHIIIEYGAIAQFG